MTHLLIATTNPNKLREIREILDPQRGISAEHWLTLSSLADLPPSEEPEETGETFEDNARLKAMYYDATAEAFALHAAAEANGGVGRRLQPSAFITVAEDSGLEIDALDGEPGVRSARFLGPDVSYPDRFAEIYRRLALVPNAPRTARFICALTAVQNGTIVFETRGVVEGMVADAPRGSGGFGYDPIFLVPEYSETLAEVTLERKLHVAHRGRAFRALGEWLEKRRTEN